MTLIAVAIDYITTYNDDMKDVNYFCDKLKEAGYEVYNAGRGPNNIQAYVLKNNVDIMVQIAGGLCCGTLGDFIMELQKGGKSYKAKKGAVVYNMKANNLNPDTHPCRKSPDWRNKYMGFINKHKEQKYPDICKQYSDVIAAYAWGKNIETCTENFLKALKNGGFAGEGSSETKNSGGGGTALDLIKQAMNLWDQLGVSMELNGDTVTIKRSDPNTAVPLSKSKIQNNSITFEEYDSDTPNKVSDKVKDARLIRKNGEVPVEIDNDWPQQKLQIAKRGHGHSIDLKALINPYWDVGKWCKLNLPELELKDEPYYISKLTFDDEPLVGLTLEPAPPSLYVSPQEAASDGSSGTGGSAKTGRVCSIISKVGGVPITDPKSLYENFKKFHYEYYESERHSLENELKQIQNNGTCNCTDFAQLYYEAYKEAGWSMEKIRYCNGYISGCVGGRYGHVWLNVDLGNGWEVCDPSGAAKGKPWGSFICGHQDGTPSYNQSWLLSDDGVT